MARSRVGEDVAGVREFVRRALVHEGHEVTVAEDGSRALEEMADAGPFDLLLTDIVMPGLDGIALALKVTKEYPVTRILLMTGFWSFVVIRGSMNLVAGLMWGALGGLTRDMSPRVSRGAAFGLLTVGAVEKHIAGIFQKLRLPPSESDHRRVLAVLAYLQER